MYDSVCCMFTFRNWPDNSILCIQHQYCSSIVTFFSYSLKQPSRNKLSKKKSVGNIQEKSGKKTKDESDSEVYGNLDASKTILLHGLESDFIEEQMSEDKEFRLDLTMSIITEMCESELQLLAF